MLRRERIRSDGRGRSRRGAALVIVTIFMVGALMLVTTMLALTDAGVRQNTEMSRHRELQAVLKSGIADAINEMNRSAYEGGYDPGNDGPGAITRTGASGANDGVPVYRTDSAGRQLLLGYYRTTVRTVGGREVLTAVAAWPSFDAPAERRLIAAAELEVEVGVPTGNSPPINIQGKIKSDHIKIEVDNNPKIYVNGMDTNPSGATDPIIGHMPGANASDPDSKAAIEALATHGSTDLFKGTDATTGASDATGANTITQKENPLFNDTTMSQARSAYQKKLDEILDGVPGVDYTLLATNITGTGGGGDPHTIGTGSEVVTASTKDIYVLPDNAQFEGKLEGSGTLIIRDQATFKGRLDWDGDIIIAGYDKTTHEIVNGATFQTDNGTAITLNGNLILLGQDTKIVDASGNAGGTVIDGAVLMLSEDGKQATLDIDGGTNFTVEGLLSMYAEDIRLKTVNGSKTTIRSSNFVFTSDDEEKNKLEIKFENGSDTNLIYDNTQVTEAINDLGTVLQTSQNTTVEITSYWEQSPQTVLNLQQAQITGEAVDSPDDYTDPSSSEYAPFGVDYGSGPWGR